jgi:hypothetical protein
MGLRELVPYCRFLGYKNGCLHRTSCCEASSAHIVYIRMFQCPSLEAPKERHSGCERYFRMCISPVGTALSFDPVKKCRPAGAQFLFSFVLPG